MEKKKIYGGSFQLQMCGHEGWKFIFLLASAVYRWRKQYYGTSWFKLNNNNDYQVSTITSSWRIWSMEYL